MFILVTQMFPAVMLFVPYYKLLTIYGLANSRRGIILVHIASVIPFCSWMMYGFFQQYFQGAGRGGQNRWMQPFEDILEDYCPVDAAGSDLHNDLCVHPELE